MPHKTLTRLRLDENTYPAASLSERARHFCDVSRSLEEAGEYDAACEALVEFWPDRSGSPITEGLDTVAGAQLSLRVGSLTGWIGEASQIPEAQERAKDLISESIKAFTELGEHEGV